MTEPTYTVSQAASALAMREDTVADMLSGLGIDIAKRSPALISRDEMDKLSKITQAVKDHKDELSY